MSKLLAGAILSFHVSFDSDARLLRLEGWVVSSLTATNERRLFTWFGRHGSSMAMIIIENVAISMSILRINMHMLIVLDNAHRLFSLYD
jgi:hypothetical protein